jgi:hypothetical protein
MLGALIISPLLMPVVVTPYEITRLIPMLSCNDNSSDVGVWFFLINVRSVSNQSIADASCHNPI